MRNRWIVAWLAIVLPSVLVANELTYQINKSGYIINGERFSLAAFSNGNLIVHDSDGQLTLPCRFVYTFDGIANSSNEIEFSSVSVVRHNCEKDGLPKDKEKKIARMPLSLQIGSLRFALDDDVMDAILMLKESSDDPCLYRQGRDGYYRFLRASESDAEYFRFSLLGKSVDYRIVPLVSCEDEYSIADVKVKSSSFECMKLTYRRVGGDYRLSKITAEGNHAYQGTKSCCEDPAVSEILMAFEKAKSEFSAVNKASNGVVVTGEGILKSGRRVGYNMLNKKDEGRFCVVMEFHDDK